MWCPDVQLAGRPQLGKRQPLSRAVSARFCAGDISRFERPTSMTAESEPSRMRVTLQSHAMRSTALAEIGRENSRSAAAAPARCSNVSSVVDPILHMGLVPADRLHLQPKESMRG